MTPARKRFLRKLFALHGMHDYQCTEHELRIAYRMLQANEIDVVIPAVGVVLFTPRVLSFAKRAA